MPGRAPAALLTLPGYTDDLVTKEVIPSPNGTALAQDCNRSSPPVTAAGHSGEPSRAYLLTQGLSGAAPRGQGGVLGIELNATELGVV